MKGTIKLKLPFEPGITMEERFETLMTWSKSMARTEDVTVLETQHFSTMSFIVIQNPRFRNNF